MTTTRTMLSALPSLASSVASIAGMKYFLLFLVCWLMQLNWSKSCASQNRRGMAAFSLLSVLQPDQPDLWAKKISQPDGLGNEKSATRLIWKRGTPQPDK